MHSVVQFLSKFFIHPLNQVVFPVPKNIRSKDIHFVRDAPIIGTSAEEITSSQYGSVGKRENEMMQCRWNVFNFTYSIPTGSTIDMEPCPYCFAQLVLETEGVLD